jgi:hypothetical protein
MIYYAILILFFIFSVLDEYLIKIKDNRKGLFYFCVIIMVLFVGLRGNVEPDYLHYLNIYKNSSWTNIIRSNSVESVESGYQFLNILFKTFYIEFQGLLFFMAFFTIYLKFKFLKAYSPKYIISILLYYCSLFFLYEFIAIRQALAMSIFMISLPYVIERKFYKFLGLIILASLFHISVIIVIPFYFIGTKKINKKLITIVLIFCFIINILQVVLPLVNILSTVIPLSGTQAKLEYYSKDNEFAITSIRLLIFSFIFLLYKWYRDSERYNLFFNIFFIGILFSTIFNGIPQFAYRIKVYFLWTDIILWVLIIEDLFKKKSTPKVLCYGILIAIYVFTLIEFLDAISQRSDNYIYPFKFFWE